MDLLGDYGSDTEESVDNESLIPQNKDISQTNKISKRGKKLVSLHAVLPSHILEQLYDRDSRNDSDDDGGELQGTVSQKRSKLNNCTNDGLSSLLSELSSVSTSTTKKYKPNKSNFEEEKIGQAFLNVKKTIICSDRGKTILNIHNTSAELGCSVKNEAEKSQEVRNLAPPPSTKFNYLPRKAKVEAVTDPTQPSKFQAVSVIHDHKKSVIQQVTSKDKKVSRKEVEKALRAGRLNVIDNYDKTCNINAAASNYVLEGDTHNKIAVDRIRVAPVAMYDTKARKDVIGAAVTGRARGKNQINFLMASAVALEENQANREKAKSHRASAKRKYGW